MIGRLTKGIFFLYLFAMVFQSWALDSDQKEDQKKDLFIPMLPLDIQQWTLSYLDDEDLRNVKFTCKYFSKLLTESVFPSQEGQPLPFMQLVQKTREEREQAISDEIYKTSIVGIANELVYGKGKLTRIPSPIFGCDLLTQLVLTHQKITRIPPSIQKLRQLRFLNLNNNQIRKVPEEIKSLKNLVSLFVEENPLVTFPAESVSELSLIKKIHLSFIVGKGKRKELKNVCEQKEVSLLIKEYGASTNLKKKR